MTQPYRDPQIVPSVPETCPHGFEPLPKSLRAHERARLPVMCSLECEQCGVAFMRLHWIRKRVEEAWAGFAASISPMPPSSDIWDAAEALYEEGRKRGHLR
jgi:hypothetical protein